MDNYELELVLLSSTETYNIFELTLNSSQSIATC